MLYGTCSTFLSYVEPSLERCLARDARVSVYIFIYIDDVNERGTPRGVAALAPPQQAFCGRT